MRRIVFLTPEELIVIQSELIERFGGDPGIRDRGLLESACYRPQSGYYDTLFEQAAALVHSLALNHAFVDGNKRIAWTATKTFLLVNDRHLTAATREGEVFIIEQVIAKRSDIRQLASWLEGHSVAKKSGEPQSR